MVWNQSQSSMFFMYSFESLVSIISCCSLRREYPDSSKASTVCCSMKHPHSQSNHTHKKGYHIKMFLYKLTIKKPVAGQSLEREFHHVLICSSPDRRCVIFLEFFCLLYVIFGSYSMKNDH